MSQTPFFINILHTKIKTTNLGMRNKIYLKMHLYIVALNSNPSARHNHHYHHDPHSMCVCVRVSGCSALTSTTVWPWTAELSVYGCGHMRTPIHKSVVTCFPVPANRSCARRWLRCAICVRMVKPSQLFVCFIDMYIHRLALAR